MVEVGTRLWVLGVHCEIQMMCYKTTHLKRVCCQ